MDDSVKQLIDQAKNVCLIPAENEPESLSAALALFYTLKEAGKNVNVMTEHIPEKLNFLVPSLDFISSPKNFVFSVPRSIADVSQVYYEKNGEALKIHLTIDKGFLKKEDISFYYSDARPDLLITLGIHNFEQELSGRLNAFGFILDTPIVNVDNQETNTRFGRINIVEPTSLAEMVADILKTQGNFNADTANCLLAGLILHYENFKKASNPKVFETVSFLMEKGGDYRKVSDELAKPSQKDVYFLSKIFRSIKTEENGMLVSTITIDDFQDFSKAETGTAVQKLRDLGIENDVLVLFGSHGSGPLTKGFFYSKKPELLAKLSGQQETGSRDWVFLTLSETDVASAKENIKKLLL